MAKLLVEKITPSDGDDDDVQIWVSCLSDQ